MSKEIRIKETAKMKEDIERLKIMYWQKMTSKVIKKALDSEVINNWLNRSGVETRFFWDLRIEFSDLWLDIYNNKDWYKMLWLNDFSARKLSEHLTEYYNKQKNK